MMDIQEELQDIFRDIFDNELLLITRETNANDIEEWDSLAQVIIIVAIEKTFNIKFTLEELQNFKNVGDFIDLIEGKI